MILRNDDLDVNFADDVELFRHDQIDEFWAAVRNVGNEPSVWFGFFMRRAGQERVGDGLVF
ncbi:hypothetical protein BI347_22195 [Chromobacterium sphagni]|uniref:Uncharacterized protein n=1 Tax=Chromobacterium sphagni TaxID=1903179 RepID=A0A1S1WT86_9NEIS|nr:hypothetical protein [Chromobacterium sphagni]OHX10490.1 hypothetical protein BI347_22195 [Chromobacterium sphagni]